MLFPNLKTGPRKTLISNELNKLSRLLIWIKILPRRYLAKPGIPLITPFYLYDIITK